MTDGVPVEKMIPGLQDFEVGLDPRHPERSSIPARILGYGEISTVFEIEAPGLEGYALKRLPLFEEEDELDRYTRAYTEYCRLLEEEAGIRLPPYGCARVQGAGGKPVVYLVQRKVEPGSVGNVLLRSLPRREAVLLEEKILEELRKVWDFNRRSRDVEVAIDGQVSNWALADYRPHAPRVKADSPLLYLDTSTPLFRVRGEEQLDPELFLRSAPSFLVWIVRLFFLDDVMNRYYDFRRVVIDLVANLYKEQMPHLIPDFLEAANRFFAEKVPYFSLAPVELGEVRSYYREDALIWRLYLFLRKFDRFFRTRILRREYPYILPGKIKR